MSFNIRANSPDLHCPVYTFPGDENITLHEYHRATFTGYMSSVAIIYGAAQKYDLDVDRETFERWKRGCSAAGLLDDELDKSSDVVAASREYQDRLSEIVQDRENHTSSYMVEDKRLSTSIQLLKNSVSEMSPDKLDVLISSAKAIGGLAVDKSRATDIDKYIDILKSEAEFTSNLVTKTASEYLCNQESFPVFETWCVNAMKFAILGDSARDLWQDSRQDLTGVEPNLINSLRLLHAARPSTKELCRTPTDYRASLAGVFARIAFSTLPDRFNHALI